MRLHIDGDYSIATRHHPMERIEARVEGGGVPRHQALPRVRALADVLSANPEAVARAIEDLGRSGCRPLRACRKVPEPSGDGG